MKGHCTGEGREMAAAARRQWFATRDFAPFSDDPTIRILIVLGLAIMLGLALGMFWWLA